MSRRIANWSLRLVVETLPPARGSWGRAMRAELDHVEDGREALAFALGCLLVALKERLRSVTGPEGARLVFAALTTGLAGFHLNCAADGLRILGGGVDPFHLMLLQSGDAATAELWRAMTPLMTLGFAALGLADLLAAILAARARRGAFAKALAAAALIALLQAATVFSVLGYTAGLLTFLAVTGLQAAFSILLWGFGMNEPTTRRQ